MNCPYYKSRVRLTAYISILLFVLPEIYGQQNFVRQSDNSGTLAIIARTKSSVIVAIDSRVTRPNPNPFIRDPILLNEVWRKIVDVGDRSSCTIVGDLGFEGAHSDVSIAVSNWANENPHVEADAAFDRLMSVAKDAFDSRNLHPGDKFDRNIGEIITTILCGGLSNGKPFVVRGQLLLKPDMSANIKKLPSYGGNFLYMQGELDTASFFHFVSPQIYPLNIPLSDEYRSIVAGVISDINNNPLASAVLDQWKTDDNSCVVQNKRSYQNLHCSSPEWTEQQIKILLTSLFESVETRTDKVGSPNIVRVIDQRRRLETEVEKNWDVDEKADGRVAHPQ